MLPKSFKPFSLEKCIRTLENSIKSVKKFSLMYYNSQVKQKSIAGRLKFGCTKQEICYFTDQVRIPVHL